MSSSSPSTTASTTSYTKRLEGVKCTKELQSLVNKCIELLVVVKEEYDDINNTVDADGDGLTKDQATNMLQEFDQLLTPQKASTREGQKKESKAVDKSTSNDDMIAKLKKSITLVQAYYDEQQAVKLSQVKSNKSSKKKKQNTQEGEEGEREIQWIPIPVIEAMQIIFKQQQQKGLGNKTHSTSENDEDYVNQLEDALSHTGLVFTPPPPATTSTTTATSKERSAFQQRLERLRLQQEERKYTKLTHNIDTGKPVDDVTARSMTYAASVGLNMIVAPISFGVFMYWFGGTLVDWIFANDDDGTAETDHHSHSRGHHNPVDIKKVLIGVI